MYGEPATLNMPRYESLHQVANAVGVSKAHTWEMEKEPADNACMALVRRLAVSLGVVLE